jgi:hypothetical protein
MAFDFLTSQGYDRGKAQIVADIIQMMGELTSALLATKEATAFGRCVASLERKASFKLRH